MKTLFFLTAALGAVANPILGNGGIGGRSDLTCANVRCEYQCEMVSGKPKCIPPPELTCATVLCLEGFVCEMQKNKPRCVHKLEQCGQVTCPSGTLCCNPLCSTCVKPGEFCTMGSCPQAQARAEEEKKTPAAPVVVDGVKCGKNTCGKGQFCCNKSCGICAPQGGACTQQFCQEPVLQ
ncbi:hypothetical protein PG993_005015 [Apiospora rasikravindrae]|uniref:Follistatin-like domain-containing protein n=1 Tax=Apiospora rasikravindrae TaxID=990691 RepID=A0ABR1TG92_9PEZI